VLLRNILQYHVVAGQVPAATVASISHADTLQGQTVVISAGDRVGVNDVLVVDTDIEASNGIIHAIDSVLTPSQPARSIPLFARCETAQVELGRGRRLLVAINCSDDDSVDGRARQQAC
jgi:hypothetical protein